MKKIFCARPVPHLFLSFHHFHIDHNKPCLPPQILHNNCFQFLLVMQDFGGKQGALWSMWKWWILWRFSSIWLPEYAAVSWNDWNLPLRDVKKNYRVPKVARAENQLISHYVHFHLYGIYIVYFSFAFAVVIKLTVDFLLRSVQSCLIRILSNLRNGIASLLLLLPPFCTLLPEHIAVSWNDWNLPLRDVKKNYRVPKVARAENQLISHYVHFHLYGIYIVYFSFAFAVVIKLTVDFLLRSVQSCLIRILSNLQNGIASLLLLLPPFCAL